MYCLYSVPQPSLPSQPLASHSSLPHTYIQAHLSSYNNQSVLKRIHISTHCVPIPAHTCSLELLSEPHDQPYIMYLSPVSHIYIQPMGNRHFLSAI